MWRPARGVAIYQSRRPWGGQPVRPSMPLPLSFPTTRPGGLEPPTTGLGNRCSIRLSYGRNPHVWYQRCCWRSWQNHCATRSLRSSPNSRPEIVTSLLCWMVETGRPHWLTEHDRVQRRQICTSTLPAETAGSDQPQSTTPCHAKQNGEWLQTRSNRS